jgi:hypothetical protein
VNIAALRTDRRNKIGLWRLVYAASSGSDVNLFPQESPRFHSAAVHAFERVHRKVAAS